VENKAGAGIFSVLGIAIMVVLQVPCAAGPGGRSDGAGAPRCAITSPAGGTIVRGDFELSGTAVNGSLPLESVEVRVDGGPWRYAEGLDDWTIRIDISLMRDGNHTVYARARDANNQSAEASINISVRNPGPAVESGTDPVCLIFAVVIAGVVASVVLGASARRMMGANRQSPTRVRTYPRDGAR